MIKVSLLNKYYNKGKKNELHVINNTTLTFDNTGLVCILGESGSGKTTLMNTISGLDDFHKGTITIDGKEIKKYGTKVQESVRNEMFGYIFQNYYLLMERTVEYNISLALSLYHLKPEEEKERIDYVLKAVDMERYRKRPVDQLSGGQQQRVVIARALAKMPKVIFADEPTGNLDEANTLKVMNILKKVSENCLVVLVTHERSVAECFADRIILIRDGKIDKDETVVENGVYDMVQDQNIYLKEYIKTDSRTGYIHVEHYSSGTEEKEKLKLQIIYEEGKYHIHVPEGTRVEFLSKTKEKQVIDDYRPKRKRSAIEQQESDFSLEPLKAKGKPQLGFRETFRIAMENMVSLGKKQAFLAVSLFIMAVMIMLTVQDISNVYHIEEENIVTTDSHLIRLEMAKNSMISNDDFKEEKEKFFSKIKEKNSDCRIFPVTDMTIKYNYRGFKQMENVTASLTDFSVLPLECIQKEDLICGQMPEKWREIVVDRLTLEKFMESGSILSNITTSLEAFIGNTMTIKGKNYRITGITGLDEPDIFVDSVDQISFAISEKVFVKGGQLISAFPEQFGNLSVGAGQVIVDKQTAVNLVKEQYLDQIDFWQDVFSYRNAIQDTNNMIERIKNLGMEDLYGNVEGYEFTEEEEAETIKKLEENIREYEKELENAQTKLDGDGRYNGMSEEQALYFYQDPSGLDIVYEVDGITYDVIGILSEDIGEEMLAFSEGDASRFLSPAFISNKDFYIYSNDKQADMEMIEGMIDGELRNKITIKVTDVRAEELSAPIEKRNIQIDLRMILTAVIFIMSLVLLYFMMKASAVNRIGDLAVYRLLGITKRNIYCMFFIETAVFSLCTTFVGIVLTTAVSRFLVSIKPLGIQIYCPLYLSGLTFLALFMVNIIAGVLPVRRLLKMPPARLAAKYDI